MAERQDPQQQYAFKNVQLFKNETLGTGSYGAVCKAKCDQLLCAAKLLYPALLQMQAPDPGKEHRRPFRRFEEECNFLSRINHPNIVQYLGTYRDPETNNPVLLMELMDESLTHFLESSPVDVPYHTQVNLSYDIAQALAFLHSNQIIHRDLSSNNVLLLASTRAKVTDFGMSKFTDLNTTRLATMTTCPGTQAFMSPEALDKLPVYTEKMDNFSFGVLLIQIATRRFPEPADRFKMRQVVDPNFPNQLFQARVLVPELERRQAHIDLIPQDHPLLPTALQCLKDNESERPTATQLCQILTTLKGTARYQESSQQDLRQLLRQKDAVLQQTIQQRDREVSKLRQELASKHEQLLTTRMHHVALQAPSTRSLTVGRWQSLPDLPTHMYKGSSAAIGNQTYFKSWNSSTIYKFSNNQWNALPSSANKYCTIVSIDDKLTTVGGGNPSNKLYSYINNQWVEPDFPPMPTERRNPAAVYTNNTLVVAGGRNATVDILNTMNRKWSSVSSLPVRMTLPSAIICREYVYIHPRHSDHNENSVYKCSLKQLVQSQPSSAIILWEKITSLPVSYSSLVTVNGHLLAVGGIEANDNSNNIYQYVNTSWTIIGHMTSPRSTPLTAILPNKKLMVVGGFGALKKCELTTII